MFSKRKGGSGKKGGGKRTLVQNGRLASKESINEVSVGRHTAKKVTNGGGKKGRRRPQTENSNSDTSGRSNTKPKRRRRKSWFASFKDKKDKIQKPEVGFKRRPKRNKSRKGANSKRGGSSGRKNVISSESSGSYSVLPMSGPQPGHLHSSNPPDSEQTSPLEFDHLPWANLEVPMDLSFVQLEINHSGVDFDLQARKSHQRWLANLEKVRVGSVQG